MISTALLSVSDAISIQSLQLWENSPDAPCPGAASCCNASRRQVNGQHNTLHHSELKPPYLCGNRQNDKDPHWSYIRNLKKYDSKVHMQNPQTYPCWFTTSNPRHYEAVPNLRAWTNKISKSNGYLLKACGNKAESIRYCCWKSKKRLLPLLHGIFTTHPNLLGDKCCWEAAWEDARWGARARRQGVGRSSLAGT